jgi:hypothetical protein
MKSKRLLLLLLCLPYVLWLVAIPFIGLPFDSASHTLIAGFSIVYTFGILFWGVPYTTFVLGFLLWSRHKSAKEIYVALSQSPLSLALIILAEFLFAFAVSSLVPDSQLSLQDFIGGFFNTIAYSLMAMFGIFIYGYVFVFLSKYVFRAFVQLKWVIGEEGIFEA